MAVRKPGYSPKRRGNGDKKRNVVIEGIRKIEKRNQNK